MDVVIASLLGGLTFISTVASIFLYRRTGSENDDLFDNVTFLRSFPLEYGILVLSSAGTFYTLSTPFLGGTLRQPVALVLGTIAFTTMAYILELRRIRRRRWADTTDYTLID